MTHPPDMHTHRQRLIAELLRERWAPLMPKPPTRQPPARQVEQPTRRPTGTGWPT